uniref:tRNA (guanine(9)-N(1))-methyltransferase n=1 Tax=Sinocyclocheilus rhinocerous TaxID=307959 RepID=A0A673GXT5_9TELE
MLCHIKPSAQQPRGRCVITVRRVVSINTPKYYSPQLWCLCRFTKGFYSGFIFLDAYKSNVFQLFFKNVMRKQRNWERRPEAKKTQRKEEKQRKKLNRQSKGDLLSKRVIKAITKERLEEARGAGLRLCVDLILFIHTFFLFFFSKEICRLACQIRRLYGCNKKALQPFRVFLTELKEDSLLYKECVRMNDGFLNYLIDVTEESWFHLFPSEDVIYLTPDASEALEYVEEDKAYILGGLVDETIQKKISYTRAKELGICTAWLPIDEYMVKRPNPKNFHSKNPMFEILLTFRDTKDWTKALAAGIPPGKGYMVAP